MRAHRVCVAGILQRYLLRHRSEIFVDVNTITLAQTNDLRVVDLALQEGQQPGSGKMLGHAYSLHGNTFDANWEMAN